MSDMTQYNSPLTPGVFVGGNPLPPPPPSMPVGFPGGIYTPERPVMYRGISTSTARVTVDNEQRVIAVDVNTRPIGDIARDVVNEQIDAKLDELHDDIHRQLVHKMTISNGNITLYSPSGVVAGPVSIGKDLQEKLIAGDNIKIVGNVISAENKDTTYTAGAGVVINEDNEISVPPTLYKAGKNIGIVGSTIKFTGRIPENLSELNNDVDFVSEGELKDSIEEVHEDIEKLYARHLKDMINLQNEVQLTSDTLENSFDALKKNINEKVDSFSDDITGKFDDLTDDMNNKFNTLSEDVNGNIKDISDKVDGIDYELTDAFDEVKKTAEDAKSVVNTLVGEDTDTSVRDIVKEELTNGLIPEGSTISSLEELATWLSEQFTASNDLDDRISQIEITIENAKEDTDKLFDKVSEINSDIDHIQEDIKDLRYFTKNISEDTIRLEQDKQHKLVPGDGITIDEYNVISAEVIREVSELNGYDTLALKEDLEQLATKEEVEDKQDKFEIGENLELVDGVLSAKSYNAGKLIDIDEDNNINFNGTIRDIDGIGDILYAVHYLEDTKQNTLKAGAGVQIKNDVISFTGTVSGEGVVYEAGDNIEISGNVISAIVPNYEDRISALENKEDKDTTYTAGNGISISNNKISLSATIPTKIEDLDGYDKYATVEQLEDKQDKITFGEGLSYNEDTKELVVTAKGEGGTSYQPGDRISIVENKISADVSDLEDSISGLADDVSDLEDRVESLENDDTLKNHIDNSDIHVTSEEKETWNNKSDFSGSYNDLTDKPTIPSIDGLAKQEDVDTELEKKQDILTAGDGITIENGVISANGQKSDWNQNDEEANDYINNRPFYTNEDGTVNKIDVKYLPIGDSLHVDVDGNVQVVYEESLIENVGEGLQTDDEKTLSVKPATKTSIGGVKIGAGLDITNDGTVYVKDSSQDSPEVINIKPDWNQNDESADDYIKNRPFYSDDEGVVQKLPIGYLDTTSESDDDTTLVTKGYTDILEEKFKPITIDETELPNLTREEAIQLAQDVVTKINDGVLIYVKHVFTNDDGNVYVGDDNEAYGIVDTYSICSDKIMLSYTVNVPTAEEIPEEIPTNGVAVFAMEVYEEFTFHACDKYCIILPYENDSLVTGDR